MPYDNNTTQTGSHIAPPSLPYAGGSGWSGSDASREREQERDSTGKTGRLQAELERWVTDRTTMGATIKEARDWFPGEHHGNLSGSLTCLHKDGRLARLTEKREKCSVYVAPRYVYDREVVLPKVSKNIKEVVLTDDMTAEQIGYLVVAVLSEHDKILVRLVE